MPKYRKKPVVVEAFQYDGEFRDCDGKYCVPEWAEKALEDGTMYYIFPRTSLKVAPELYIKTLKGTYHVSIGDFIIRGVHGELYPCKPDIFAKTYELVEE